MLVSSAKSWVIVYVPCGTSGLLWAARVPSWGCPGTAGPVVARIAMWFLRARRRDDPRWLRGTAWCGNIVLELCVVGVRGGKSGCCVRLEGLCELLCSRSNWCVLL